MRWVDSHCHLNLINLSSYQGDSKNLIQDAQDKQVEYIMCVGVDIKTTPAVLNFAQQFDCVYASVGIHPSDVHEIEFDENWFKENTSHKKVIAIGETGLDYHYPDIDKKIQQTFFQQQIEWAKTLKKPLIIHSRDAADDTLRILKETHASEVGGVLHCFTGDLAMAEKAIEMGFYIGISGIVTFKKANMLQDVVKALPLERLLLETDAPWLAPAPFRGKPNTPEYIPIIGEAVAALKNISIETVAAQTTDNFLTLFNPTTSSP
jgi:TatD DNase family protein